jgi:transcriptional regulator with XRE-family HTH domain
MSTPAQIRAARALMGLSQAEVAERAGISVPTIKRAEADRGIRVSADVMASIRRALEKAGVIFVEENGEGAGVRLRKTRRDEGLRPDQLTTENDT